MDLTEFTDTFFEEADELLQDIERHLLDIDLENPDSEQLAAVFRAAHSIKGGAGTFGFTILQDTTHLLENLLDDARKGELALSRSIVDTFLGAKDMLQDQLDAYKNGTAPDQEAFEALCKTLQQIAKENAGDREPESGVEPESDQEGESVGEEQPKEDGVEIFEEASALGQSGKFLLEITLSKLSEEDQESVMGELNLLGTIVSVNTEEEQIRLSIETLENPEDIEAVLCFVIDSEQLSIEHKDAGSQVSSETSAEIDSESGSEVEENQAEAAKEEDKAAPEADKEQENEADASAAPETKAAEKGKAPDKPEPAAKKAVKAKPAGESVSIRVAVDKVDQVINLVGELIITQSMLEETVNRTGIQNDDLSNGINLLQRNARDLQDSVMSIRMLPMDYVFSRFPRLVRDLAGKMGKEIELVTEGEATELDKGLTEKIIDPLTHLVRNSLDHGIEQPEDREAAGKPRTGTLTLSAQHQGGNVIIEVSDDGAGLDRDKILAKAASRGLQMADDVSDEEVWQLIFAAGFSTAEVVSDLSGRGVGMDVVKRNIHAMGGRVEIKSRKNVGTTTRIILPLTLAILDGMLIRIGDEIYILPVSSIIETLQLQDKNMSELPGKVPMLKVRDEYYPVVSIHAAVGSEPKDLSASNDRKTAVMVQDGSKKYVMLVDELLGQQQVVVKNIESNYKKVAGVSGATILGDGSVALILDIGDLYRLGNRRGDKKTQDIPVLPPISTNEFSQAADT